MFCMAGTWTWGLQARPAPAPEAEDAARTFTRLQRYLAQFLE